MTVQELIAELSKYPPGMRIITGAGIEGYDYLSRVNQVEITHNYYPDKHYYGPHCIIYDGTKGDETVLEIF